MSNQTKLSPEARERAVRLVLEYRDEYPSMWAAAQSIAPKSGCSTYTLTKWVRQHEVDDGARPGITTAKAWAMKQPHNC